MKRFAILAAIFSFLMTLVPGAALAEVKAHEASGVQLDTPAGWNVSSEEDQLMIAHESGVAIVVTVIEGEDLKAAIDALDEEMKKLQDFKVVGEAQTTEINGLAALTIDGTATLDGTAVEVGVALIDAPKDGKVLVVFGIGTPDAIKAQEATIGAFLQSIKKAG